MGKALKQPKRWHLPPLWEYLFRQADQFILPGWRALSDVALHCSSPSSSLWLKQRGTQEGKTAPLNPNPHGILQSLHKAQTLRRTSLRLRHVAPDEHYQQKQLQCLLLRICGCWQWLSNKTKEWRRCSKPKMGMSFYTSGEKWWGGGSGRNAAISDHLDPPAVKLVTVECSAMPLCCSALPLCCSELL